MSRMVSDLLLLAKAERPDFLQRRAVDVDELTDSVYLKATAIAGREWRVDTRGAGVLIGDPERLTQALINLAANAADHTRPGDLIVIGSNVVGDEVRFWVRDHGPGIPEDEQPHLFERFARGRAPGSREGAGLGLAIVRAIAETHGGRVEVVSRPGAGATFTIVLPGVVPSPTRPAAAPPAPATIPLSTTTPTEPTPVTER
jgi:signal transduction histidine kinase